MNTQRSKILSFFAWIFFLIPASILALWMYAFNQGSTQAERLVVFHAYLPELLHPYNASSVLSLVCCALAVVFSAISNSAASGVRRVSNVLVMLLASLLFMLNLFGMM